MNIEPYEKMIMERAAKTLYINCHAPDELFGEWKDLPLAAQQWYETHILACDGGGQIWVHCIDCPFCEYDDE